MNIADVGSSRGRSAGMVASVAAAVFAVVGVSFASGGTAAPVSPIDPPIVFEISTVSTIAGSEVAVDGDWLAVRGQSPQVLVFKRDPRGTWTPHSTVNSPISGTTFGASIVIRDGTMAIGQPGIAFPPGRVHLYALGDPTPTFQQTIVGPPSANPAFGSALAIEGDTLLVGFGFVWHYERDGSGTWQSMGTLPTSSTTTNYGLGQSVVLLDGRAVVGDPTASIGDPPGWSIGKVLIFERTKQGEWLEPSVLSPPSPQGLEEFGASVSIDDSTLAVGAPARASVDGNGEGCVFVYHLEEQGAVTLEAMLRPRVPGPFQGFGRRVIAKSGAIAVLRAPTLGGSAPPPGVESFVRLESGEWRRGPEFAHPALGSLVASMSFDGATLALSRGRLSPESPRVGIVPLALDCDGNGALDALEAIGDPATDCNLNMRLDECDVAAGGIDVCSDDCDSDGVVDWMAIALRVVPDCNGNGRPDACDIALGSASDVDGDGVPDSCAPDCNGNGVPDLHETTQGLVEDCDRDGVPDSCGGYDPTGQTITVGCISTGQAFTTVVHARRFEVRPGLGKIARVEFAVRNFTPPVPQCPVAFVPVTVALYRAQKETVTAADAIPLWGTSFVTGPLPTEPTWYSMNVPGLEVGDEGDVFFAVVRFTKPVGCSLTGQWCTIAAEGCSNVIAPACGDSYVGIDWPDGPTDLTSLVHGMVPAPWAAAIRVQSIPCDGVADFNRDGAINGADITTILGAWGPCAQCGQCEADLNSDCTVDGGDIAFVLGFWTG